MIFEDTVILLFAKAPVAGSVNTRLIPHIGVEAATRLQSDLVHQRLQMLTGSDICQLRLLCAPDSRHAFFLQCKKQYGISLHDQSTGDLGLRMLAATRDALQQYNYCIVIGSDAPALDLKQIRQAIEVLHAGTTTVFVPAEDGGYVLAGMHQVHDYMFHAIDWGTAEVMQQSLNRLVSRNISCELLETCWDIDRPEDYQRYLRMSLPKSNWR